MPIDIKIWRSESAAGSFALLNTTSSTSSIISDLVPGASYYYRIQAGISISGNTYLSNPSPVLNASPVDKAGAPIVKSIGANQVELTWKAVPGGNQYQIWQEVNESGVFNLVGTTAANSSTIKGLTEGLVYNFRLRALRVTGSSMVLGEMGPARKGVPIGLPGGMTVLASNDESLAISWSDVSQVTGYQLYRSASPLGSYVRVYQGPETSYTNTAISKGAVYYYKVRAYKLVGDALYYGPYTDIKAGAVLQAPVLTAKSTGEDSIRLSWTEVPGATGYTLYGRYGTEAYTMLYSGTGKVFNETVVSGELRAYRVLANLNTDIENLRGPYSPIVRSIALAIPTDFYSIDYDRQSIAIYWEPVAGADGYHLMRSSTEAGTYRTLYTGSKPEFYNEGLKLGQQFFYKVRAFRKVGDQTVYGPFTLVDHATVMIQEPKIYVYSSSSTSNRTGVRVISFTNNGHLPVTIRSGMRSYDDDYSSFNRSWTLVNSSGTAISSQRINARSNSYLNYYVVGNDTWMDKYTNHYLDFVYDGVTYTVWGGYYYGWSYYKK